MRRRPSADSAIPSHNAAHMPPSWPRPWRLSHLGSNVGTNIGAWKGVTKLETGGRNTAPVCYLNITDDELSESANLSDGGVAVLILDGCQKSVQQIHFKTKFLTTLLQWFRNKVLQIVKENSNCNWYLPPNKSRPAIVLWIRPLWQPASSPPCTLNQSTRGLGLHHVNILPFNGFPFFPSEIQYKRVDVVLTTS